VHCVGFDSSTQREAPRSLADFLEAHIASLEGTRDVSSMRPTSQPHLGFPSPPDSNESETKSRYRSTEKCTYADSLVNQVMEDITPSFLGITQAMPLLQVRCLVA
jgi:hypothetical protein